MIRTATALALLGALASGCTPTARTAGPYAAKAVRAAASARSSAGSDLLLLAAVRDRHTTAAYVSVATSRAEDEAASAASTFLSVQPPDGGSTRLREALAGLLDRASSVLSDVRIAGRRGDRAALLATQPALRDLAARLDDFVRAYR